MRHDPEHAFVTTLCELMRRLTETALKVLLHVSRQTLHSSEAAVAIAINDVTQTSGLSRRGAIGAVQSLTSKQLLSAQHHWDARGGAQPTR